MTQNNLSELIEKIDQIQNIFADIKNILLNHPKEINTVEVKKRKRGRPVGWRKNKINNQIIEDTSDEILSNPEEPTDEELDAIENEELQSYTSGDVKYSIHPITTDESDEYNFKHIFSNSYIYGLFEKFTSFVFTDCINVLPPDKIHIWNELYFNSKYEIDNNLWVVKLNEIPYCLLWKVKNYSVPGKYSFLDEKSCIHLTTNICALIPEKYNDTLKIDEDNLFSLKLKNIIPNSNNEFLGFTYFKNIALDKKGIKFLFNDLKLIDKFRNTNKATYDFMKNDSSIYDEVDFSSKNLSHKMFLDDENSSVDLSENIDDYMYDDNHEKDLYQSLGDGCYHMKSTKLSDDLNYNLNDFD